MKFGRFFRRAAPAAVGAGLGFMMGGPAGAMKGAGLGLAAGGMMGGRRGGGDIPQGAAGPNPADAALPYLEKIPGAVGPYLEPYVQSGREAEEFTNPYYESMASDPGAFIDALMKGYKPSEGYRFKQGQLERAMRNESAAGGFIGTPYAQQQQAELVQGLLGQDMQQFLNNLLGVQATGMSGYEGRTRRGFEAASDLANIYGSNLGQMAGLRYQGGAQQNQNIRDIGVQNAINRNARRQANLGFLGNILGFGARAGFGGGLG